MTNEPKAGGGLDPEMLAAYIDKRLPPDERAAVEAQLASDPDSYELLVELIHANEALKDAEPEAEPDEAPEGRPREQAVVVPLVPKPSRTRTWAIAGGVIAVAAALVLIVRLQPELWQRLRGGEPVDPQLARLVAAVGEERYIEARLTGGFKYGPLVPVTRGPGDLSRQNLALLSVSGELQQAVKEAPTAANMSALGVAYLHLGSFEDAIRQLESATRLDPRPESLVNLSAAYMARAKALDRDSDLSLALQVVETALARSPQLAEGLFNRALILESFNLTASARDAWDAFLAVDSTSPWADEARRHRSLLKVESRPTGEPLERAVAEIVAGGATAACALVERDGQLAREVVEDLLLPRWADLFLTPGGQPAAAVLDTAGQIAGCASGALPGDLTAGAVQSIRSATDAGKRELAQAHQLWRTGRAAYARSAPAEFSGPFEKAGQIFERHRSPLVAWTRQYEIGAFFYAGDLVQAHARTLALESDPRVTRGGALWARLQWNKASINFQRASFGEALQQYGEALTGFEATRERENVVAMHQSLSETYGRLGLAEDAWRQHREALEQLEFARDYRRVHSALTGPGYTAHLADLPGASMDFFLEGRSRAIAAGNINYQFECEVGVGRALVALRRFDDARPTLQRALALQPRVTNPSLRARLTSDIYIGLSEMAAHQGQAEAALEWADQAIASVEVAASEYRLAALHLGRGRALRQLRRFPDAARAFEDGIDVLESKRALLQQASQRISYTDRAWDLYSDIIGLVALDLGDSTSALRWAERSRARSLHDARPEDADPIGRLSAAPLPAGSAILVLASTDRGLFSWLISGQSMVFHHAADDPAVNQLATTAGAIGEDALAAGFEAIARPFASSLAGVRRLTVVPDSRTQTIPFAALFDRTTRKHLVTTTALNVAPSVAMALAATALAQDPRQHSPASIAVVTADDLGTAGAPPLPGARAESRQLVAIYPHSQTLEASKLSVGSLREVMRGSDVLHVAMHAVADGRYLNQMTLGIRDDLTGGWLNPETVFGADARAPRLVVLAACQTARGPARRGEILLSLARPFLIAGASNVVVTLWDVPDDATERLMVAFHAAVVAGIEPAEALARAQRSAFEPNSAQPWWSAFVMVATG